MGIGGLLGGGGAKGRLGIALERRPHIVKVHNPRGPTQLEIQDHGGAEGAGGIEGYAIALGQGGAVLFPIQLHGGGVGVVGDRHAKGPSLLHQKAA